MPPQSNAKLQLRCNALEKALEALTKQMEELKASHEEEREDILADIHTFVASMREATTDGIRDGLKPYAQKINKGMKEFSLRLVIAEERTKILQKIVTGSDSDEIPEGKGN